VLVSWAGGSDSWLLFVDAWIVCSLLPFFAGVFFACPFPEALLLGLGFAVGLAAVARGFFGAPLFRFCPPELLAGSSSSDSLVATCHGTMMLGEQSSSGCAM
jgi:hypothetical protein